RDVDRRIVCRIGLYARHRYFACAIAAHVADIDPVRELGRGAQHHALGAAEAKGPDGVDAILAAAASEIVVAHAAGGLIVDAAAAELTRGSAVVGAAALRIGRSHRDVDGDGLPGVDGRALAASGDDGAARVESDDVEHVRYAGGQIEGSLAGGLA